MTHPGFTHVLSYNPRPDLNPGKKKPRRHMGATGVQFLGSQDLVENACSLLLVGLFSQGQF